MPIINYNGQLRHNEIFGTIFNMIISQQVFADNIKGTFSSLVDDARVDGTLYGDTKLYYATDALESVPWDGTDTNLLETHRPDDPSVQAIYIDKFRQIRLTLDNYLTKRAFSNEGTFLSFNSVMLGWMGETKRIYDATIYNSYIGTTESEATRSQIEIPLSDIKATGEERNRLRAQTIAQKLADLMIDLKDVSRDFNDYGYMRSYTKDEIRVIWNSKYANQITKLDLPTIYNNEGLFDIKNILPERYFGTVITADNIEALSAEEPEPGKPINSSDNTYTPGTEYANGKIRSLVERVFTINSKRIHIFAGDIIPTGAKIGETADEETAAYGEVYFEKDDIICKIVVKLPPYMSAFRVSTSFFNPKSLTENHYLTFGHNTLQYLYNFPFITMFED